MTSRDLSLYSKVTEEEYNIVAGSDWPSYNDFLENKNVTSSIYDEINSMLWNLEKFNNPAFCILPFYGLELPQNTPCCIMQPGHDINQVKQDMLNGIRNSACRACWSLEDRGIKSDRIIKNETLDFYSKKDIKLIYNECANNENLIINYKIDTNNTCNATCITCNSHASSSWANLERKNGITPNKSWNIKVRDLNNRIDYANAKSIGFRGGEPFLSKTNFDILEKLIEIGNTDCFINFTTNGSSDILDYQKNILRKFKNINFCFSIDGIGPVFEYMRYPLTWDKLEENLEYCRKNNILISASYTVSNLNILYHEQTVDWFNKNNIEFLINPVKTPFYFNAKALPSGIKDYILKHQTNPLAQLLFQTHSDRDDVNYGIFQKEIKKQDQWKNISMADYLPELAELMVANENKEII